MSRYVAYIEKPTIMASTLVQNTAGWRMTRMSVVGSGLFVSTQTQRASTANASAKTPRVSALSQPQRAPSLSARQQRGRGRRRGVSTPQPVEAGGGAHRRLGG